MSRSTLEQVTGDPGDVRSGMVLSAAGLRKEYGAVIALADASLDLRAGEIHALVGENGSGKSTFVGLVSGVTPPTSGNIEISGQRLERTSPAIAAARGVVTVFQDGTMLPELTVAQNLFIGTRADLRPSYGAVDAWAADVLEASGITGISPRAQTKNVPPGDRQLMEIARAMFAQPRLLMLDEATSALDSAGVDRVMELIVTAAQRGSAVLFVTHRLGEVFRVAQNVSILRDGVWQGTMPAGGVTADELVSLMAGTSVETEFPARPTEPGTGAVVLTAERLSAPGVVGVDLQLRAGEIVGIAGADGNGQGQLLAALGAVVPSSGRLTVNGTALSSPASAVTSGVVYLSGDRRRESLFASLSVRENLNLAVLDRLSSKGILNTARESEQVKNSIDKFGIRVGSPSQPVSSLSGGNQQKVALSRALSADPRVVLIDEPTRGVDVRSRMDIYRMLRDAANQGLAVTIVSSDAAELAGVCDRIVVMSRGRIIAELPGEGTTEDRIVEAFAVAGHAGHAGDAGPAEGEVGPTGERAGLFSRLSSRVSGAQDLFRMGLLVLVLLGLFLFARNVNPAFGSTQNIYNVLLLMLPITLIAAAEFSVLVVGGIDIAVGATMGLSLVGLSFWATDGPVVQVLVVGLVVAVAVGLLVGVANAVLIERMQVTPVVATIATMGIAGGLALILRPTAGGLVSLDLMNLLTKQVGPVPVPVLVVLPLLLLGDWLLWRTGLGVRIRAVGLHPLFAMRLGIPVVRIKVASYLLCGVVAGLAGLILASTVGTGDATAGNGFTLLAIAAPVLGGASLMGGRGSFIGCLLGSLVLAMANSIVPMLGISDAWSFMIVGLLSIVALLAYSSGGDAMARIRSLASGAIGRQKA